MPENIYAEENESLSIVVEKGRLKENHLMTPVSPTGPMMRSLVSDILYLPAILAQRLQFANVVYSWLRSNLRDRNTCTQANTPKRNSKVKTNYNY
jgi:hypothetical protein